MYSEFIKAGAITGKVREESKEWVKAGVSYTELADKIENRIKELGALPAFPVNISANNVAAHDTAKPGDERELKSGDVVKVDLGAHVNGWPGDTAYTIEIDADKHVDLIKASEEALKAAINKVEIGVELREIGREIESVIMNKGYQPIRNLGGHPLGKSQLHGEFIIPNFDNNSKKKLETKTIAIEPFATTGEGWVENDQEMIIYSLENPKPVRNVIARKILKHVQKYYGTLPFAERWVAREFKHYEYGLRELLKQNILHGYHILKERSGGVVAQTEHSLLLNEKKVVTTKIN